MPILYKNISTFSLCQGEEFMNIIFYIFYCYYKDSYKHHYAYFYVCKNVNASKGLA